MMPTFNWELSVWNVVVYLIGAAIILWRSLHVVDKRIAVFEQILSTHASTLAQHAGRMDVHDERLLTVIEQLQRLIGQGEGARRRSEHGTL
jgi:hypothetical protein